MIPDPKRQLLRAADVADLLSVSPRVVYAWVATGVIPPEVIVRAGRAIYFKRQAFVDWLSGRNSK